MSLNKIFNFWYSLSLLNCWKSLDEELILIIPFVILKLGGGGVQGQGKGQRLRLMGIKAVNDYIGLATCQSKI